MKGPWKRRVKPTIERVSANLAAFGNIWAATPRLRAQITLLSGAALTAIGTALVYLPAGVILGGIELIAYGGLLVDVNIKRR